MNNRLFQEVGNSEHAKQWESAVCSKSVLMSDVVLLVTEQKLSLLSTIGQPLIRVHYGRYWLLNSQCIKCGSTIDYSENCITLALSKYCVTQVYKTTFANKAMQRFTNASSMF